MQISPDGLELLDEQPPQAQLPAGVPDPFTPPVAVVPAEVSINGYRITSLIQRSNAGGAYQALAPDGTAVFVKEARGHNGYDWDGSTAVQRLRHEHRMLTEIHAAAPGLCPAPVELFAHWEHEFLATELVPGRSLWSWMASVSPTLRANRSPADFADYYARCRSILRSLRRQVDRLHELGYVFGDLNPNNVLVDDGERPRLIDFEAARRGDDRLCDRQSDRRGLAALAQTLLHPIIEVLDRYPPAAAHLRADLADAAHLPEDLWRWATRYRRYRSDGALPPPREVERDPQRWLRWLRERTGDALLAMAEPGAEVGTAGIAWVLADLGRLDAARALLAHANSHQLLVGRATLGYGAAGVALAHLAIHRHDGDQRHLDRAALLLDDIPDGPDLVPMLGRGEATGWLLGRTGIAHALYHLGVLTGDDAALRRGRRLLHEELAHGYGGDGGLTFHGSRADRRVVPFLAIGSAGFAAVAGRYLRQGPDDGVLRAAYTAALASTRSLFPLRPALFQGLSGLGFVLSDLAQLTGDDELYTAAVRSGRGLFKYAIPGEHGVRFLAEAGNRFSADLAHGSAGVLLFLAQLTDRSPDALFTLDTVAPAPARPDQARVSPWW